MDAQEPAPPKGGCLGPLLVIFAILGYMAYLALTGQMAGLNP